MTFIRGGSLNETVSSRSPVEEETPGNRFQARQGRLSPGVPAHLSRANSPTGRATRGRSRGSLGRRAAGEVVPSGPRPL